MIHSLICSISRLDNNVTGCIEQSEAILTARDLLGGKATCPSRLGSLTLPKTLTKVSTILHILCLHYLKSTNLVGRFPSDAPEIYDLRLSGAMFDCTDVPICAPIYMASLSLFSYYPDPKSLQIHLGLNNIPTHYTA